MGHSYGRVGIVQPVNHNKPLGGNARTHSDLVRLLSEALSAGNVYDPITVISADLSLFRSIHDPSSSRPESALIMSSDVEATPDHVLGT